MAKTQSDFALPSAKEGYAMGSIRVRNETGKLFFDFKFQNIRCREQITLRRQQSQSQQIAEGDGQD
jgi:hypothetical protein